MPVEGWRFLKSWEKKAVPKLVAAGYEVRGDNAVRTRARAHQLINLERDSSKGGRFTINLAVGHEFARSFRDGKPIKMTGYEEAVFHARLGRLMEGKDLWWPYGEELEASEKFIDAISEVAIAYADAWFETIKDPGAAYILLKKGDLGRENLWNLAIYAHELGRHEDAFEWLERISGPPPHVEQLKKEWSK